MFGLIDQLKQLAQTRVELTYSSKAIEALKWVALISMLIDHYDFYLLGRKQWAMFAAGRFAFPIFAFILAYNLAQRGGSQALRRALPKLALAGIIAQPFFHAMRVDQALNIMLPLALGAWLAYPRLTRFGLLEPIAAIFLSAALFPVVEYSWIGILFGFASCVFCQQRTLPTALFWWFAFSCLTAYNGTRYTWLSMALLVVCGMPYLAKVAEKFMPPIPRISWLFYAFYPMHLIVLWLARGGK